MNTSHIARTALITLPLLLLSNAALADSEDKKKTGAAESGTPAEEQNAEVTLGTPSAHVSDSTNVGWLYERLSGGSQAVSPALGNTLKTLPPVPTTSIYSRSDGVVAWEACRVTPGPMAENVEVDSSHLGLVWHPGVLRIVADRLSQVEDEWTPWNGRTDGPATVDRRVKRTEDTALQPRLPT